MIVFAAPTNKAAHLLCADALDGVPMKGNVEFITLFSQSMNQVPVQGAVPFNITEP